MRSSFTIFKIRGIEIGAHWTWLLVFGLVTWSLASALFPATYPGLSSSTYFGMAVVTAVLFFASIILHELGHAFQAVREDMQIDGITLWIFGGVARFKGMFPSAAAEARIAAAGPAVSVVLVGVFLGVAWLSGPFAWPSEIVGVADYLARINLIVVGFNLVPALPLDGGRVLRAYLWHRQRSFAAATESAAKAGYAFGMMLVAVGILGLFSGSGIGSLWIAFIGWFLVQASRGEASLASLSRALRGLEVADVMSSSPDTVEVDRTVEEFVDDVARTRRHATYPVVDRNDELVGLMSVRLASDVPPERRAAVAISEVMVPKSEVAVIGAEAPVFDVIEQMQSSGHDGHAVVVSNGHVEGIVSTTDIARSVELGELQPERTPSQGRRVALGVWAIVALCMLAAAAYLYHPPLAVIQPGPAVDVTDDIEISGVPVDDVEGEYLLTSVRVGQTNALGVAFAWITGDEIFALSEVFPRGVDPRDYLARQRQIFEDSRMVAAAAAARAAGLDVSISGDGARVLGVAPDSPAAGSLRNGDLIVAVDGRPVRIATDVSDAIGARPEGSSFDIRVRRDGRLRTVTVRSAHMEGAEGVVIGVLVGTEDLRVDLPFEVRFRERDVGGPSAGAAYALALTDLLDRRDLADGRTIAATGTIGLDGRIGAVGAVEQKARGAQHADADVFVVPAGEVNEAEATPIPVFGASSLDEAIALLVRADR